VDVPAAHTSQSAYGRSFSSTAVRGRWRVRRRSWSAATWG